MPLDPGIVRLRRHLHQWPELSGREEATAAHLARFLGEHGPAQLLTGLGGCGLAAVYEAGRPGPTILLRAELDALALNEAGERTHRSKNPGRAHLCGHDGHMALLAGLAPWLAATPLRRGRVVLLFQPAEETGQGAARLLADPRAAALRPDWVFALHNLPGHPLGQVLAKAGPANPASVGLEVRLLGKGCHAAHPEQGVSPAPALAALLSRLPELPRELGRPGLVTVCHAALGEPSFGSAPETALVQATLRAGRDEDLEALRTAARELAAREGAAAGLTWETAWREYFPAVENHPAAVTMLAKAARAAVLDFVSPEEPFAWSEDFGHFTRQAPGALFCLGAGLDCPPLHNPVYDFPESLLEVGLGLYQSLLTALGCF
ncbi:MAG: amidohydrolase [Deltaproteobacteria bacterium]|nr:amidohydrolase [Deltaproteobacteria bacterium]